jgi:FtsH-binding integral membrane protein
LFTAAAAFAMILCAYGIFLYKRRERQIQIISYACLFQVIAFGTGAGIFFSMGRYTQDSIWELSGVIALVFALMFELLAIRAIKSDIRLIKSMDRIR